MQAQSTAHWHDQIIDAGVEALDGLGAVVVRFTNEGPQVVSRPYEIADYDTTKDLRRVAVRRATQLRNQDESGWNYYVVIRYVGGQVVAWTGMHSILCERDGAES